MIREGSGDDDFAVRLDEHGPNLADELANAKMVETGAQGAVALEPAEVSRLHRGVAARGLHNEGGDRTVGVWVKIGIGRAAEGEAGEITARGPGKIGKRAAHKQPGIGLNRQGRDLAGGGSRRGVEGAVNGAVGVEPDDTIGREHEALARRGEGVEAAAHDHLTAGQNRDGVYLAATVGIKRRIDGAVGVEAGDPVDVNVFREVVLIAEETKETTGHDFAVGLKREGVDLVAGAGVVRSINGAVGVEARDEVAHGEARGAFRSDGVERAGDDDLPVALHHLGEDVAVDPGVPRGVHRAIGIQARRIRATGRRGARVGREEREVAADEDLAVTQHGDDGGRGVGAGVEAVERAIGIEAGDEAAVGGGGGAVGLERGEGSADHDLLVGALERERGDLGVGRGVKRGIDRAIAVEPGEVTTGNAADIRKRAADDDLAVGLNDDRVDNIVGDRGKGGVHRAVGIEASEEVTGHAAQNREVAADKHFAVGLHRLDNDAAVGRRVEGRVNRAVGVEASEVVPIDRGDGRAGTILGKITAGDDLAVGLEREGLDRAITGTVERHVEAAVDQETRHIRPAGRSRVVVGAQTGESAADQQRAVGLNQEGVDLGVGIRIPRGIEGTVGVEPGETAAGRRGR